MSNINNTSDRIYQKLKENGVCHICAKRYLYVAESKDIIDKQWFEESNMVSDDSHVKTKRSNSCIICFDVFHEEIVETVEKLILESGVMNFDCETFCVALILPPACELREQKVYAHLKTLFPLQFCENSVTPRMGLKETWKYYICPRVSKLINKTQDLKSELMIQITLSYDDENNERNGNLKNDNSHQKKMKIDSEIGSCEELIYPTLNIFSLSVPNKHACCKLISVRRDSIFIAGRYNKFSRTLSQTPWILCDGERKTDSSVEEIISKCLIRITKSSDSRFSSSGREDVDVRMLGNGRPFAVELINAKVGKIPNSVIARSENEINHIDPHSVLIRDLQVVKRNEMIHLKHGEENKTKDYCAVCFVKVQNTFENLIKTLLPAPFTIEQKTPLRVLHRRTVATRKKIIHELNIDLLNRSYRDDGLLIKLNVKTQAGTYVKEFIHGDFGRTFPSISLMFGEVAVDVLALDVTNVEVDWPPSLNYQE